MTWLARAVGRNSLTQPTCSPDESCGLGVRNPPVGSRSAVQSLDADDIEVAESRHRRRRCGIEQVNQINQADVDASSEGVTPAGGVEERPGPNREELAGRGSGLVRVCAASRR